MKDKADKKTIDMLKEPAKTGAERQKAYRERLRKQHKAVRLDLMLDSAVMAQLQGIMMAMGEGKKEVLNRLISAEFKRIVNQPDFKLEQILSKDA
ncbi:hypothetical protein E3998_14645 [Listeria monocytogenes]|jgi:hypothetical protein|nr:hypothetical protein [Listeria monocytogenes]